MSTVKELHDKAMVFAGEALVARMRGNLEEANKLAKQALPYETQAASTLVDRLDAEPSRSVLYRSTGSLAMQCEQWDEAERLFKVGLAGRPPESIAAELHDLLEKVRKHKREDKDAPPPQAKKHTA